MCEGLRWDRPQSEGLAVDALGALTDDCSIGINNIVTAAIVKLPLVHVRPEGTKRVLCGPA